MPATTQHGNEPRARVYPLCCQSMYCGRSKCAGCEKQPVLQEFEEWVKTHAAVMSDPVWSPTVYVATK